MTNSISFKEKLERLRDELRTAASGGTDDSSSSTTLLIQAAQQQHTERVREIGVAPEWRALNTTKDGAAGTSLVLDVVGLSAEASIKLLGGAGADLDNRAHALVDLWARSEAGRSLLMELFDHWPQGAPAERVAALNDTLRAVCLDSAARVLEGNFGGPELLSFIQSYVDLQR